MIKIRTKKFREKIYEKGEKMSQADKGILLFSEWLEAMDNLSGKAYKELIRSIYRYQIYGEEPVEFKGEARTVAKIIFPCVKRRIAQSKGGKKSAETRRPYGINPVIDELMRAREEKNL